MTTKQQSQSKKDNAVSTRSVMLTRFKLSQQKSQLKEKDNHLTTIEQILRSPPKQIKEAKPNKTCKINKSPKKCKTDKKHQKTERAEFCPNNLKRDKVVRKIILKPKHKLKIIGQSNNGSKRKFNELHDETKSSTRKRNRPSRANSTWNCSDGSQSPADSELSIKEMIRMAEENRSLSDDDLMEILTCPSPVWWEDPPHEGYVEDPIILKSFRDNPSPAPAPQSRSKHSRKKTPHKIIMESILPKDDRKAYVDDASKGDLTSESKKAPKFTNKMSKLENLLSIIKNKLYECKTDKVEMKREQVMRDEGNVLTEAKNDTGLESLDDDTLLPDISPHDSDCLNDLENMEIPTQKNIDKVIDAKEFKGTTTELKAKRYNRNETLTDRNRDIPTNRSYKNKDKEKLKSINGKKASTSPSNAKTKRCKKKDSPVVSKNPELCERKIYNSFTIKNKISPKTRHKLLSENGRGVSYLSDSDDSLSDEITNGDMLNDECTYTNTESDFEEYMTVFKIISTDDHKDETECSYIEQVELPVSDENTKIDRAPLIENDSTDRGKMNSYYRICKKASQCTKKSLKDSNTVRVDNDKNLTVSDSDECKGYNFGGDNSIVVHDTKVKYCRKCSSIFDMDECNYCIRREKHNYVKTSSSDAREEVIKVKVKDCVK